MGHVNIQVHMQQVGEIKLPDTQPRSLQEWHEVRRVVLEDQNKTTEIFRFNTTEPDMGLASRAKLCRKAIMHLAVMAGDAELLTFLQGRDSG